MGLSITSRGLRPIADAIAIHRQIRRSTFEGDRARPRRVPTRPVEVALGAREGAGEAWDLVDCRREVAVFSMA